MKKKEIMWSAGPHTAESLLAWKLLLSPAASPEREGLVKDRLKIAHFQCASALLTIKKLGTVFLEFDFIV